MRAVYLAIFLGFLRKLLRRVLVSPGRTSGREHRVWLVIVSGCGLRYCAGGPWRVNWAGENQIAAIAGAWSIELPGDLIFSVSDMDVSRMPGIECLLSSYGSWRSGVESATRGCIESIVRQLS